MSNSTDGDSTFGSLECADIQRGAEKLASLCSVTPLTPIALPNELSPNVHYMELLGTYYDCTDSRVIFGAKEYAIIQCGAEK